MKKTVIIIIAILLGAGALAYPSASDYLARKNGSEIVQAYTEKVAELDDETKSNVWAEAESYNEILAGWIANDFFYEGAGEAKPDDYGQALNIDGIMGYVDIPKINIYLPIYHGTADNVLNKGAGHLEGSALPIGGASRHSVITGHSGLVRAKMFTDLTALIINDIFYIHVLGETLAYEVNKISVIEPDAIDELAWPDGKDYCTLLTCTPYGVNTHRLLVRGERVEYISEEKESIQRIPESETENPVMRAAIITASVMLILIAITAVLSGRRKRGDILSDVQEPQ